MQQVPGWLKAALIAALLVACAALCWFAPSQYELRFQRTDLALSLNTSRQREAKQQHEYDQVVQQLPQVQAQLEEIQPLAAAAKEKETELRALRKQLRSANADLADQLAARQAELDALLVQEAQLQQERDALAAREQALREALEALTSSRPGV